MIGLSTNEFLAGVTMVVCVGNIVAIAWLWRNIATHLRTRSRRSFWRTFMNKAAYRVAVGFIIKSSAITAIFLGRMPLRAIRDAGNEQLGAWWLSISLWWEIPAAMLLVCGLSLIMWPAFNKTSRIKAVALVLTAAMLTYGMGVAWVAALSDFLKP